MKKDIEKGKSTDWSKENMIKCLKEIKDHTFAFLKKYTSPQTWKDSMIPEHPEYNQRLKHFFVMVMVSAFSLMGVTILIFLVVNTISAPRVRMPDVAQKDLLEAVRLVQIEQLAPSFEMQFSPENPRYTVIEQYPSAGRSVRKGRKVTLVVSLGQDTYTVPDLEGLTTAEAEELLQAEGVPYQLISVPAGRNTAGSVISQNYGARSSIARENPLVVTVTEEAGSSEYKLDNFVRQNLQFSVLRLLNNGITPQIIKTNTDSISEDGMVLAQSTAAGTPMLPSAVVQLTVGTYARDQIERSKSQWSYINYRIPSSTNRVQQEIISNEDGIEEVIVHGETTTAKYYHIELTDELGRRTTLYERNGGEGTTVIRAFKYYGSSTVVVMADNQVIEIFSFE